VGIPVFKGHGKDVKELCNKEKEDNMPDQSLILKKIDHINIVVQDLEAAKNFFLNLGFIVLRQGILEGEWIDKMVNLPQVKAEHITLTIPQTQTNLELIKYYTPEGQDDPQVSMPNHMGFRHMALEVKDIESAVWDLKQKGISFFGDIQMYNNAKKLCYFLGPEGIILELDEYL
jgi:catechol 2,3-dioxygenase-like lactoylglutathione lyase family enzyme